MCGQLHTPLAFPPGERVPGTHSLGSWVSPIAGLDDVERIKLLTVPGLELWSLRCPIAIPTALPLLLDHVLNLTNSVRTLTNHCLSWRCIQNPRMRPRCCLRHLALYLPWPDNPHGVNTPSNKWWGLQIMKFLIMEFSPDFWYRLSLCFFLVLS
jgi:hypothetical protein